jgi:hypothetical protein
MNVDMDGGTINKTEPYFHQQCLKPNPKTNQLRFVKPLSPFKLLLIIPSEEWDMWDFTSQELDDIQVR